MHLLATNPEISCTSWLSYHNLTNCPLQSNRREVLLLELIIIFQQTAIDLHYLFGPFALLSTLAGLKVVIEVREVEQALDNRITS